MTEDLGPRVRWAQWPRGDGSGETHSVAVTTTLWIAHDTGKRHANMGSKIAEILDQDPGASAHFRRIDSPLGTVGARYWFECDAPGTRLLFGKFRNEPGRFSVKAGLEAFTAAFQGLEADRWIWSVKNFGAHPTLDATGRVVLHHTPDVRIAAVWWRRLETFHDAIAARLRPLASPPPLNAREGDPAPGAEVADSVVPFARPAAKAPPTPTAWGDVPETEDWKEQA
jgi:hypothetical protein